MIAKASPPFNKLNDRAVEIDTGESTKPLGSGVEVMFSSYEAFALMAALLVLEHGVPQAKAEESRDVTAIAALGQLTERNNDARAMLLIQDGTRERLRDGIPQGGESPKGSDERAGRPR